MPQPDPAVTLTIDSLNVECIGHKVRVAGRILSYDEEAAVLLLYDSPHAILTDVSLCIDPEALLSPELAINPRTAEAMETVSQKTKNARHWSRCMKEYAWIVGYLEQSYTELPIPALPGFLPLPDIDTALVLRALSVTVAEGLDVGLLRGREESMGGGRPYCASTIARVAPMRKSVEIMSHRTGDEGLSEANWSEIDSALRVPGSLRSSRVLSLCRTRRTTTTEETRRLKFMHISVPLETRLLASSERISMMRMYLLWAGIRIRNWLEHALPHLLIPFHPISFQPSSPPVLIGNSPAYPVTPIAEHTSLVFDLDRTVPSDSRIPISAVRPGSYAEGSQLPSVRPAKHRETVRYDPLHILSRTAPAPRLPIYTQSAEVTPGVLPDGVLTGQYPPVRQFLAAAETAAPASPSLPDDVRVSALAALAVFYNPMHPAHWVFWNDLQQDETAQLVQTVLDVTPRPIVSSVGWIDKHYMLNILGCIQSIVHNHKLLSEQEWFAAYPGPGTPAARKLRKRKLRVSSISGDDAGSDIEGVEGGTLGTLRKRIKARKPATRSRRLANPQPSADEEAGTSVVEDASQPTQLLLFSNEPLLTRAAKRERMGASSEDKAIIMSEEAEEQSEPEEAPQTRTSLRQRERRAKANTSPLSSVSTLTPAHSRESTSISHELLEDAEEILGDVSGSSTAASPDEDLYKSNSKGKPFEDSSEEAEGEDPKLQHKLPKKSVTRLAGKKLVSMVETLIGNEGVTSKIMTDSQPRPRQRTKNSKSRRR
ncbi:hypothetical protein CONPUDRAFT_143007 [Coniophora puteana RWD-64-598 SS2]|uniref:Uncharacterized protein n=1 Tax=Coniophora puteana (strain RWD-64-598) TaxID=741705 RepID=A0A5M3MW18_CONPW|nr:uncharacterized protein CONPUDRAFT_143007 [Coniophora puteana RWD-64-598 SS2]EIW82905.1 hypothetical protein CONPUDRAFT_143007 [Coniophora puteana RWD-64-598 SS2]